MAWAKLDDAMPHHPKVMMAGPQGFALDVAAICYSNRFGCDGFIADEMIPAVLPSLPQPKKWAARLVQAGRWVRDDDRGGWVIHDIGDYQPSAEEQEADRAAARERMRELRARRRTKRSESVRPNSERTEGEQAPHVRAEFVTPSRPAVPNGTDQEEDARAGTDTWVALARHTDATRWADLSASKPQLLQALAGVEAAGWKPDVAARALLGSLNGAKQPAGVVLTRARALANAPPDLPGPRAADCHECAGTGLLWLDDGRTAVQCTHGPQP